MRGRAGLTAGLGSKNAYQSRATCQPRTLGAPSATTAKARMQTRSSFATAATWPSIKTAMASLTSPRDNGSVENAPSSRKTQSIVSCARAKQALSSKQLPVHGHICCAQFGSQKSALRTRSTWNPSKASKACPRDDTSSCARYAR